MSKPDTPPASPTHLDTLAARAAEADRAEAALKRDYAGRLAALERERGFAHRRLHLFQTLAQALDGAEDEAAAFAASDAILAAEFGLSPANDGHRPVIERFRQVADALDTVLNCEGEPDHAAVLARMEAFEAWYAERTGQPFMALYDVYVPQTPVVDF